MMLGYALLARGQDVFLGWVILFEQTWVISRERRRRRFLRFGPWSSWTTEGLYKGLKLLVIEDCSLIDPLVLLSPWFVN